MIISKFLYYKIQNMSNPKYKTVSQLLHQIKKLGLNSPKQGSGLNGRVLKKDLIQFLEIKRIWRSKNPIPKANIEKTSRDTFLIIASKLNYKEVIKLCNTNRYMKEVVCVEDSFWRDYLFLKYPGVPFVKKYDETWKQKIEKLYAYAYMGDSFEESHKDVFFIYNVWDKSLLTTNEAQSLLNTIPFEEKEFEGVYISDIFPPEEAQGQIEEDYYLKFPNYIQNIKSMNLPELNVEKNGYFITVKYDGIDIWPFYKPNKNYVPWSKDPNTKSPIIKIDVNDFVKYKEVLLVGVIRK